MTLDALMRGRMQGDVMPDRIVTVDGIRLHVREVVDGKITVVGFAIPEAEEEAIEADPRESA
jgi:hypothetical protein